ncbi:MAG: hypothetical protein E7434_04480 [Ruminococcaceae bacterium]|nr:hypothetical protein [Oscillospiraceae bacterium]
MGIAVQDWLEAQQGVVGSMLIDNKIVPDVLSQMRDTDFNGPTLMVYQAIRHIFTQGMPVDPITIRDKLGPDMTKYLLDLMEITPTAACYKSYMALTKKQAKVQQLKEIGQMMADSDDADELQALLEKAVSLNTDRSGMHAISMQEAVLEFISRHDTDEKPKYLPWHIPELKDLLFVEPGDFVVLGGRPSAGKTAFALQTAWAMAETMKVAFFSLETKQKKLTDRQIADICEIPFENIKKNCLNDKHWNSVYGFFGANQIKRPMDLIVDSSPSVSDIAAFAAAKQYQVIFIDYLQLLDAGLKNADQYTKVTKISMDLHRFAQSTGCAVIALSQLNRGGAEKGKGKTSPDMTSLRESGQLEQDADAVLLLYLEDEKNYASRRVLKCAKNKDGERFRMMLDFDGKYQRFSKAKDFQKFNSDMARISRERKEQERLEKMRQMQILPDNTPAPFEEGQK